MSAFGLACLVSNLFQEGLNTTFGPSSRIQPTCQRLFIGLSLELNVDYHLPPDGISAQLWQSYPRTMSEPTVTLSTLRWRRGVVRASITRLTTHLEELETKVTEPSTLGHAHKMTQKLESLDSDFKSYHYSIVDGIQDDEHMEANMAKEQEALDKHDTDIADLFVRLELLIATCKSKMQNLHLHG